MKQCKQFNYMDNKNSSEPIPKKSKPNIRLLKNSSEPIQKKSKPNIRLLKNSSEPIQKKSKPNIRLLKKIKWEERLARKRFWTRSPKPKSMYKPKYRRNTKRYFNVISYFIKLQFRLWTLLCVYNSTFTIYGSFRFTDDEENTKNETIVF